MFSSLGRLFIKRQHGDGLLLAKTGWPFLKQPFSSFFPKKSRVYIYRYTGIPVLFLVWYTTGIVVSQVLEKLVYHTWYTRYDDDDDCVIPAVVGLRPWDWYTGIPGIPGI